MSTKKQTNSIQTLTLETAINNNETITLSVIEIEGGKMFTMQLLDIDGNSARITVSNLDTIITAIRSYQGTFERLNSNMNPKRTTTQRSDEWALRHILYKQKDEHID